ASVIEEHPDYDDMGVLFFDANGDGHLDLYVASGGSRYLEGAAEYQDRLYVNDGRGNLSRAEGVLPALVSSSSVVVAADFDRDGDLDLFVGGRLVPRQYSLPGKSYILENREGRFVDVTREIAPQLERIGMVTDASWSDFDSDGTMDRAVVGEWMPLTILQQKTTDEGIILFEEITSPNLELTNGWWNGLAAGDFDGDGYIDYVAGNLGLNARWKASKEEPISVYAKDFDGNGSIDPIMFQYLQGEKFAVPGRGALTGQIPSMENNIQSYYKYATTTFNGFFSQEQLKDVHVVKSHYFSSALFHNQGTGDSLLRELPNEAQVAPLFGMVVE